MTSTESRHENASLTWLMMVLDSSAAGAELVIAPVRTNLYHISGRVDDGPT